MLSIGTRLCPPASTLPSSPTSASTATRLVDGARRVVGRTARASPADPAFRVGWRLAPAGACRAPDACRRAPPRTVSVGRRPGRGRRPVAVAVRAVPAAVSRAPSARSVLGGARAPGPGGSRRSSTIVPSAMPVSLKLSVNISVVLPIAMMMPAATGTRLIGLPKSTRFSFQIFAPSRPIMPYSTTVMPPSTPPGVAETTAPNFGREAEHDRHDRGDVVGGGGVDPGRRHDADVLGVRRGRRAADRRWRATVPTPSAAIARPITGSRSVAGHLGDRLDVAGVLGDQRDHGGQHQQDRRPS